ncbi:MAG: hypothetical protein D6812_02190 [Deltaproteobacteria bacterium]|nr:MAG: hypothetical protein D6812_02190 [Deltaproteobacteria bacterium]
MEKRDSMDDLVFPIPQSIIASQLGFGVGFSEALLLINPESNRVNRSISLEFCASGLPLSLVL